jgi:peptidoglycan/LPS O-acetylase OafA/YrhL
MTNTAPQGNNSSKTLLEGLSGHNNSLGLIRLLLAAMVIVSHAYPLGGFGAEPLVRYFSTRDTLGGIAVAGFFGLSGFLIIQSGLRSDALQFMWRRALRIFPAYWSALALAALVVGPLVWLQSGREIGLYFELAKATETGGAISYLANNWSLTIGQYGIYDIFRDTTPYGLTTQASVLNGSIWTLTYEWSCYLAVGFLIFFGILKKSPLAVPAIAAFLGLLQILNSFEPTFTAKVFPFLADNYLVSFGFIFFVGATIGIFADKIRLDTRLGVLSGATVAFSLLEGGWTVLGFLAFPYFLLWIAATLPKYFQKVGQKNDYSYGIYVYGFIVQQATAHLGLDELNPYLWTISCLLTTFAIAWVSWHLIEKQALKLKSWGPGVGIVNWTETLSKKSRRVSNQS